LQIHPKNADLITKPIKNYAQIKITYVGDVLAAQISPFAIHRALSHLMDHKAQDNRYLAMVPGDKMAWFTAFLGKYYL
jgi:hypothetical protein